MTTFSLVVPTYRRPEPLNFVLRSFLDQHSSLHEITKLELVIVEGDPIDETRAVIRKISREYGERVSCVHLTTSAFGYVSKVMEGFSRSTGDYLATLTDEDFTQYDFLTPILSAAREHTVYPVPFTGSGVVKKVHAEGYPSYFRHGVPAFPHYVCSRSIFGRLLGDVVGYRHYVTDHHIPLLCWELGLKVVFVSDFLRVPPLLHLEASLDATTAAGSSPSMAAASAADRTLFRRNWPLGRKRGAVDKMLGALVDASGGAIPGVGVARCRDEYFLARHAGSGAPSLAPYYSWVKTPLEREQLAHLLSEERLNTPRWSSEPEMRDTTAGSAAQDLGSRISRRLGGFIGWRK